MTHLLRIVTAMLLGGVLLGACSGPAPSSPDSSTPDVGSHVYHVQLQLTDDKDRAEALLSRGLRWWKRQSAASRPPLVQGPPFSDAAVSIKWRAPLYRVRIGPFATEKQAETVLQEARSAFPDAFVAPDRVEAPS